MAIEIAPSTLLADVDDTLDRLVRAHLRCAGREAAAVAFDPPDAAWAASTPRPVVNLFLYDLREAKARRVVDWTTTDAEGRAVQPPLRLEVSYAVTAWAESAREEHGLLSELLAVLHGHRVLPGFEAAVARPPDDLAARLVALGAPGKPALRYTVLASVPGGVRPERAPEVRSVRARLAHDDEQ
jgi:hypothetical protein